MSIKADISHFFALMKYILDNIDDRQISMVTSFRKKIRNTFIFARLSHKIIQYDQIPLRYVQVICVVDIVGDAFIKLDSRHYPHHIKIGRLPLTITPNDTLRSRTYSRLSILQERFHPYSFAALCTSCNDARKRCNPIHRKSLLPKITSSICMDNLLVAKEITRICKRFTADVAFIRHVYFPRVCVK